MRYYRVKIGYGKDEFISIDETELRSAIGAQGSGGVAVFKEGTVSGNHIISITPDYNRALGFSRDYTLTGEDYAQLRSIKAETELFLENVKRTLRGEEPLEPPKQISEAARQLAREKTVSLPPEEAAALAVEQSHAERSGA